MKATELRIGNWVSWTGKERQILINDIVEHQKMANRSLVEPIPLTEEWLDRLGFEKNENRTADPQYDYWKKDCLGWNLTWTNGNLEWQILKRDLEKEYRPELNIKYVHQLQNLYHSLTGEELTKQLENA